MSRIGQQRLHPRVGRHLQDDEAVEHSVAMDGVTVVAGIVVVRRKIGVIQGDDTEPVKVTIREMSAEIGQDSVVGIGLKPAQDRAVNRHLHADQGNAARMGFARKFLEFRHRLRLHCIAIKERGIVVPHHAQVEVRLQLGAMRSRRIGTIRPCTRCR